MNLDNYFQLLPSERCLQNRLDAVPLTMCIYSVVCGSRKIALSAAKNQKILLKSS